MGDADFDVSPSTVCADTDTDFDTFGDTFGDIDGELPLFVFGGGEGGKSGEVMTPDMEMLPDREIPLDSGLGRTCTGTDAGIAYLPVSLSSSLQSSFTRLISTDIAILECRRLDDVRVRNKPICIGDFLLLFQGC